MTSPSWAAAPAATRPRSARRSSGRRWPASRRSPSSAAPACASGCIPTKAWVQTAHFLHQGRESFGKLGVTRLRARARLRRRERVEGRRRQADDGRDRAASSSPTASSGSRAPARSRTRTRSSVEGGEDVTFKQAIVATGSFPIRPPIDGLDSDLCVDSTGLLAQTEVPRRLVVLGGGIIGCEFASIFQTFGSEVTVIEMLDRLIAAEDEDAAQGARASSSASAASRSSSASSARRSSRTATR